MSDVHCSEQKLEGVWCHSMKDDSIISLLQQYQSLLQGLMGPKGSTLLLQHKAGLDTFVNSSSDLSKNIYPHHPCLKFINCLMQAQESTYGSCALYLGILCSSLLRELLSLQKNEKLSSIVIKDISDAVIENILSILESKPENVVAKLDISRIDQILAFVNSCISSKNLGLSSLEKDHLCIKIVEAFLETVPKEPSVELFGEINVTTLVGRSALETEVIQGLLYRETDPNNELIDAIKKKHSLEKARSSKDNLQFPNLQKCSEGFLKYTAEKKATTLQKLPLEKEKKTDTEEKQSYSKLKVVSRYMQNSLNDDENEDFSEYISSENLNHSDVEEKQLLARRNSMSKYMSNSLNDEDNQSGPGSVPENKTSMRVLLIQVPLAFEKPETEALKFVDTSNKSNEYCFNAVTVKKLKKIIKLARIDVIACQKFVSPVVKYECEREGVLFLERLGTKLSDHFQKLTGCLAVTSIDDLLLLCRCQEHNIETLDDGQQNIKLKDDSQHYFVGSWPWDGSAMPGQPLSKTEEVQQQQDCGNIFSDNIKLSHDKICDGASSKTYGVQQHQRYGNNSGCQCFKDFVGLLQNINVVEICNKTYYQLDNKINASECFENRPKKCNETEAIFPSKDKVVTLLLPAMSDIAAQNLKVVVEEALRCVRRVGVEPWVVAGGGCLEAWVAGTVATMIDNNSAVLSNLVVSISELKQVTSVFARVFAHLSRICGRFDLFYCHLHSNSGHLLHLPPEDSYLQSDKLDLKGDDIEQLSEKMDLQLVLEKHNGQNSVSIPENLNKTAKVNSTSDRSNSKYSLENIRINSKCVCKGTIFSSIDDIAVLIPLRNVYDIDWNTNINKSSRSNQNKSSDNNEQAYNNGASFTVSRNVLVENYSAKLNAIRLAFEGTMQLFDVEYCVFDR